MAGSGTLDFIEFVQMMTKTSLQSDPYKEIQEAFRVFDTNHTGRVDCSEMKLVFTTIGQCISNSQRFFFFLFHFQIATVIYSGVSEEEANEIIRESDANGDGYLEFSGQY